MKHIVYQTSGTCSQQIDLDIDDDDRVRNVQFLGGCNGNLQGVSRLVEGMKVEEVKERLGGIRCGYKSTSCPDQLVRALEQAE
ncbi:MAG: TIGR03905 family TSCPD domain-containing protein [Prevotella sp.]|nr:TIGR03905 family TSCPD domain-containing protein [Prevotella sp.]